MSGKTPCKFFAAGNCRFGSNCKFSHSDTNNRSSYGGGHKGSASKSSNHSNRSENALSRFISVDSIDLRTKELKEAITDYNSGLIQCKPLLSSMGFGNPAVNNLISGRDMSFEEIRLLYEDAAAKNHVLDFENDIQARTHDMDYCIKFLTGKEQLAVRYSQKAAESPDIKLKPFIDKSLEQNLQMFSKQGGAFGSFGQGSSSAFGSNNASGTAAGSGAFSGQGGAFGSQSTQGNPFGQANNSTTANKGAFGSSGFGSSGFGSSVGSTNSQSGFGSSGFGSSGFGKPATTGTTSSGFGSSAFGNSNTSGAFGNSGFGSSGFGSSQTNKPASSSGFGSAGFGNAGFGNKPATSTSAFGSSAFGASTNNSNPSPFGTFGNAQQNKSNPFGATSSTNTTQSAFGNTSNAANPFASANNTASPFGAAASGTSNPSPFGNTATSAFGNTNNSSTFGATNTTTSAPPFGSTQSAASPFGQTNTSSPFGSATNSKAAGPFGNVSNGNAFGNASTSTSTASPFDTKLGTTPASNPFAPATTVAEVAAPTINNEELKDLDPEFVEAFKSAKFELGRIPELPPPPLLCQ
ncbi:uncharacterized protein RJT20DRAFT_124443 [Scheffersomyces xylosifermentans]|uniref:uncharacterized protein n=1 Tax=Scheffersomyces xylosifermentans TaxID=1304137 RepID=UPI00315CF3D3